MRRSTASTPQSRPAVQTPARETYLGPAEVAGLLHVNPKTIARWAKQGKLPYLRTLGGHRRYPERAIRALADQLTVEVEVEVGAAAGRPRRAAS